MKAFVGFCGFGGVDIALREQGYQTIGVEIDPLISEVNRYNGGNVITADLLTIDPALFVYYYLFHFSPPCPNFSIAKSGAAEQDTDLALAHKICEFIRVGRPKFFTLENVWMYRKSLSWLIIWYTLLEQGYGADAWSLNAADYGVPQTRRRMICIARRDGKAPVKPFPTHSKKPDMFTQPWAGWYEAIEDLIPGLPESRFAPWQWERMPEELKTLLMMTGNTNRNGVDNVPGRGFIESDQPSNAVATQQNGSMPRALLIPGDNTSSGVTRAANEPMVTVQTRPPERCPHRAFILGQGERSRPKESDAPADTVTANGNQTGVKALVFDSANSNSNGGNGNMRDANEPIFTVTAAEKSAPHKAFIVDCQNNGGPNRRGLTIRQQAEPVFTMTATQNRLTIRAGLTTGRVVSMTPRCLARFQSFPDWFTLPQYNNALACRGIGNAVPPMLYKAVLKELE